MQRDGLKNLITARPFIVALRQRMFRILVVISASMLVIATTAGCECRPRIVYEFQRHEHETNVGSPVYLSVVEFTEGNRQQETDVTHSVSSWKVDPADGASVERGIFNATKPGTYKVTMSYERFSNEIYTDEATVTVTGQATGPSNEGSPHDNIQGTYAAKLAAAQCSTTSSDQSRSVESADLLFTVSGQEVSVDITSSNGTHTYTGQINTGDGSFKITSQKTSSALEVTGAFSNTGVSGTWKNSFSNGDVCNQSFQGNRR